MIVAMMNVRPMRVRVGHRLVTMGVRMFPARIGIVMVTVVAVVVAMRMLVLDAFVGVLVLV